VEKLWDFLYLLNSDFFDSKFSDSESKNVILYFKPSLHLCASKTPTKSADLTGKGNSYHALEKCEGVKCRKQTKTKKPTKPINNQ
jgi:hypothetical protein